MALYPYVRLNELSHAVVVDSGVQTSAAHDGLLSDDVLRGPGHMAITAPHTMYSHTTDNISESNDIQHSLMTFIV